MPNYNDSLTNSASNTDRVSGRSRKLVADDTKTMLGGAKQRKDNFSVFRRLDDPDAQSEKNLSYPLNLGDLDASHFMLFKIYNGHSEQHTQQKRAIQKLERKSDIIDQAEARAQSLAEQSMDIQADLDNGLYTEGSDEEKEKREELANVRNEINQLSADVNSLVVEGYNDSGSFNQETGDWETGGEPNDLNASAHARKIDQQIAMAQRDLERIKGADARKQAEYKVPETLSLAQSERLRNAEIRQKETIALFLPHKLNVAGFNTYDTPSFSVIKEVEGIATLQTDAAFGTLLRRGAGMLDDLGSIVGGDINAQAGIQAVTGRVLNPRRETLFQAPEMRKFEFAFEFTPRNLDETYAIDEIIRTFKRHAYPSKSIGGYFFDMPAEFALEYYVVIDGTAHRNAWLNKIARCVLAEINVDYTGAGSVSMFNNGAPTHINLTLSFQETELITQEYIDEGY